MDVTEKCRKTLAQDVFDIRCEIFNSADLCSVVNHNPNTSPWCHCCHFLR